MKQETSTQDHTFIYRFLWVITVVFSIATQYFADYQWIGYPFILASTIAHEFAHGLTAIILGGSITELVINPDTSGYCSYVIEPSRISSALIAAGGLIGPAIASIFMAWGSRSTNKTKIALWITSVILVFILLKSGTFLTAVSIGVYLGILLLTLILPTPNWLQKIIVIALSSQLAVSVFSRSDYLFTEKTSTGQLSDVAKMAEALWLPYWFWGAVCGLTSIAALAITARLAWQEVEEEDN